MSMMVKLPRYQVDCSTPCPSKQSVNLSSSRGCPAVTLEAQWVEAPREQECLSSVQTRPRNCKLKQGLQARGRATERLGQDTPRAHAARQRRGAPFACLNGSIIPSSLHSFNQSIKRITNPCNKTRRPTIHGLVWLFISIRRSLLLSTSSGQRQGLKPQHSCGTRPGRVGSSASIYGLPQIDTLHTFIHCSQSISARGWSSLISWTAGGFLFSLNVPVSDAAAVTPALTEGEC